MFDLSFATYVKRGKFPTYSQQISVGLQTLIQLHPIRTGSIVEIWRDKNCSTALYLRHKLLAFLAPLLII